MKFGFTKQVLLSFAMVLFGMMAFSTGASAKTADCRLTVDGQTYIDGACTFKSSAGGSFMISAHGYSAQVQINDDGSVQGFWNGEERASHLHSELGELSRNDDCWSNDYALICAR